MEQRLKISMKELVKEAVDELKKDMKAELKREIKQELNAEWNAAMTQNKDENAKVLSEFNSLKEDNTSVSTKLSMMLASLALYETKLGETQGTVVRQDQMINELKMEMENTTYQINTPNLCIGGLLQVQGQDRKTLVSNFFKHVLKIEQDISIDEAFRVGKGKTRTMIVKLTKPNDKAIIFKQVKNLKDVLNANNKPPYSVSDQLSARRYAKRRRERVIQQERKVNRS